MPPSEEYLRGAIATADRVADVHPEDWDGKVYEYVPIGHVPFTGILDAMEKKITRSRHIHWWEEPWAKQRGTVLDVYADQNFLVPYAAGGAEDDELYFAMSADDASQLIVGMTILVMNTDTMEFVQVDVVQLNIAGDATTWVFGALLEDDTTDALAGANLLFTITGEAQAEGSALPDALGRDVVDFSNQTQIFAGALEATGTEIEEEERIDGAMLPREKRRAQMRLLTQMEWANLLGVLKTKVGPNGKPRRFMEGVITAMRRLAAAGEMDSRLYNYATDPAFAGMSWLSGGWDWLKGIMNDTSRTSTGTSEKEVYCGILAWQAINDIVEDRGSYKIEDLHSGFGIRIRKVYGLHKTLNLIEHPLFSENPAFQRAAFITEMGLFKQRPMRNRSLKYIPGRSRDTDGYVWIDGIKAGWMAEVSLQYNNLEASAFCQQLGMTNAL